MTGKRAFVTAAAVAAAVGVFVGVWFAVRGILDRRGETPPALPEARETTAPPEPSATPPPPLSPTDTPAPRVPSAPGHLASALGRFGLEVSDLGSEQILLVESTGNEARIWAYGVDENGDWCLVLGGEEGISGWTGEMGVSREKSEGDRCTPAGVFRIGFAFGNGEDPGTGLPYRDVTPCSLWVDDPASLWYNRWVEEDEISEPDWASAERLADYGDAYRYAAAVEYNTDPVVPGAGSAIFLHCGSQPTAGCVAVPAGEMETILRWLDGDASPVIVIE